LLQTLRIVVSKTSLTLSISLTIVTEFSFCDSLRPCHFHFVD